MSLDELLPDAECIKMDVYGNGWLQEADGTVWFVCHDPPIVILDPQDREPREVPVRTVDGWEEADLTQPGDSFTWGHYGPGTELERRGPRTFARKIEKRKGFFSRLFGG